MNLIGELILNNPAYVKILTGLLLIIGSYLIGRKLKELEAEDKRYEQEFKRRISHE